MEKMRFIPGYENKGFDWEGEIDGLLIARKTKDEVRSDCFTYKAELSRVAEKVLDDVAAGRTVDFSKLKEKFARMFAVYKKRLDAGVMLKSVSVFYDRMLSADSLRVKEMVESLERENRNKIEIRHRVLRTNGLLADILRKTRAGEDVKSDFGRAFEAAALEVSGNSGYTKAEKNAYAKRRVGRLAVKAIMTMLERGEYKAAASELERCEKYIPEDASADLKRRVEKAGKVAECVKIVMSRKMAEAEEYYLAQPVEVQREAAEVIRKLEGMEGRSEESEVMYGK